MRVLSMILTVLIFSVPTWAQRKSDANLVAVSQGISAPAITSPVNYNKGFTSHNPAVAAQLDKIQVSVEYDTGDNDDNDATADQDGFGVEAGAGAGGAGIMLGYYDRDCTNCDSQFGGIVGFDISSVSVGLGYREENTYSLGFLINNSGEHRLGIVGNFTEDDDAPGEDVTAYGLGYSYNADRWVFALDASKYDDDNDSTTLDEVTRITPGILVKANWLSVSLSYDMYVDDKNDVYDDDLWFGLGFGGDTAHLAIYHDYMNEWTFVGTVWF